MKSTKFKELFVNILLDHVNFSLTTDQVSSQWKVKYTLIFQIFLLQDQKLKSKKIIQL